MAIFDKTKLLFDVLKNMSFWDRIFRWKRISHLLMDATGEIASTEGFFTRQSADTTVLQNQLQLRTQQTQVLENRKQELEKEGSDAYPSISQG